MYVIIIMHASVIFYTHHCTLIVGYIMYMPYQKWCDIILGCILKNDVENVEFSIVVWQETKEHFNFGQRK